MQRLTFKHEKLAPVLEQAERDWPKGWKQSAYDPEPNMNKFWLVGDHGVYVMHNGQTEGENAICYAEECNPETDPDGWYETKRATFGGDDGCETFDKRIVEDAVKNGLDVQVIMTPSKMSFHLVRPRATA